VRSVTDGKVSRRIGVITCPFYRISRRQKGIRITRAQPTMWLACWTN
jgi:hypothetical protein